MKYLVAIWCVGVLCVSCKKDKDEDVQSQDNSEITTQQEQENSFEKDEYGLVVIEDEDTASIALPPTGFYKTESGKYKYVYNLKKNQTYPLNTQVSVVETVSDGTRSMSQNQSESFNVSYKVLDQQNGFYKMAVSFGAYKSVISSEGQSISIDTKSTEPTQKDLKTNYKMRKALEETELGVQMDKNGKVVGDIVGLDAMYANIKKSCSHLKGDELEGFMNMVKTQIMSPEIIKDQIESSTIELPKEGVALGESWTKNENNVTRKYTFKEIKNNQAVFTVSVSMPAETKNETQEGITISGKKEMSVNGQISLDIHTGWVSHGKITQKSKSSITFSKGNQKQSQNQTITTTTQINP